MTFSNGGIQPLQMKITIRTAWTCPTSTSRMPMPSSLWQLSTSTMRPCHGAQRHHTDERHRKRQRYRRTHRSAAATTRRLVLHSAILQRTLLGRRGRTRSHLTARPPHYSLGTASEMQLALTQTYDGFAETLGALDSVKRNIPT